MFQEFFPILEGAPMGDLWILLALGLILMMGWMGIFWVWQRKHPTHTMDQVGWTSGLILLALLDGFKADGYGPRRFLISGLMCVSAGFLARRYWFTGEAAEPLGFRGIVLFECRALQAVFLSLPVALLVIDPLPMLTAYEWIGLVIWIIGMGGQILLEARRPLFEWLIWISYFIATLATPYGAWTIICPLVMLPVLRPFQSSVTEEENPDNL